MTQRHWTRSRVVGIALGALALALTASPVEAQETPVAADTLLTDTVALSLEEAERRAVEESEEIRLARSQVDMASAQVTAARSAVLPQVNASLGYTRTFASPFDTGGGGFTIPDSLRFEPDPDAPIEQRVTYLEDNVGKAAFATLGGLFGDLPFGQENAYTATITGSQLLYSGGRVGAAMDIARNFRESAQLGLTQQQAEIQLQVRTAYYQALLAQELETIAAAAVEQAQEFLDQEQLRLRAGQASELEVMRAEVSLANLRPQLVEARNAADLASLNVKRLIDIPLTQPVQLTTPLEVPPSEELEADRLSPEVIAAQRATLEAAERQVDIRRQQVRVARGAYLPSVSLNMNYGRQIFPTGAFNFEGDWRTDWTLGVNVSLPLFEGFRRGAEMAQARVQLEQSRLQLGQLRESIQLQYEQALAERERARTSIAARQRAVEMAERVYDLTVLRYDEGLATQLEVTDARLALLQSRTNLAQALADYYIADAGLVQAAGAQMPAVQPAVAIPTTQTQSAPTGTVPNTPNTP